MNPGIRRASYQTRTWHISLTDGVAPCYRSRLGCRRDAPRRFHRRGSLGLYVCSPEKLQARWRARWHHKILVVPVPRSERHHPHIALHSTVLSRYSRDTSSSFWESGYMDRVGRVLLSSRLIAWPANTRVGKDIAGFRIALGLDRFRARCGTGDERRPEGIGQPVQILVRFTNLVTVTVIILVEMVDSWVHALIFLPRLSFLPFF